MSAHGACRSARRGPSGAQTWLVSQLAWLLLAGMSAAQAAPTGGAVVQGRAEIGQSGGVTTVVQSTPKALINWTSFNVKPTEAVVFQQPSSAAVTVNNVTGQERSVIEGVLRANGQIYLVNANGVWFAPGSSVQAAGLVASALPLAHDDAQPSSLVFRALAPHEGRQAVVVNEGVISVADGGAVVLIGQQVTNTGRITTLQGQTVLAAGDQVRLGLDDSGALGVTVEVGALNALIDNGGAIVADGGRIQLTAKATDDLLGAQVNTSGLLQARSLGDLTGNIQVTAVGGRVNVDGTLDASAPAGGDGGRVETAGSQVSVAATARIDTSSVAGHTGWWTLAARQLQVAASGGDMAGGTLSNQLARNNVALRADGDVLLSDAVQWPSDTRLSLNAGQDITIRRAVTATGAAAGLALNHGGWNGDTVTLPAVGSGYHVITVASGSGTTASGDLQPQTSGQDQDGSSGNVTLSGARAALSINGQSVRLVHGLDELAEAGAAGGLVALAQDIDASAWSALHTGAASVVPVFSGTLAGMGHVISHLTLNRQERLVFVGLIGSATGGAVIRDLGLEQVDLVGTGGVGALIGRTSGSGASVDDCYATGRVTGNSGVGGLIGNAAGASTLITHAFADVTVTTGTSPGAGIGGLLGVANGRVQVDQVHALGKVTSTASNLTQGGGVGGLIGAMTGGDTASEVSNAYATGAVTGPAHVGGLIGKVMGTAQVPVQINRVLASGTVRGTLVQGNKLGGLIGSMAYTDVSSAVASGEVRALLDQSTFIGGLIGWVGASSAVKDSHADTVVTVGTNATVAGGLVGYLGDTAVVSGSHSTGRVSGTPVSMLQGANGAVATSPGLSLGGLVGESHGTITASWSRADVVGEGAIGGLVGEGYGPIRDVETWGNVSSGSGPVGGVVGVLYTGPLVNFKVHGKVSGVSGVGGAVGGSYNATIGAGLVDGTVMGIGEGIGWVTGVARGSLDVTDVHWQSASAGPEGALGLRAENLSNCASRGVCGETTAVTMTGVDVLPRLETQPGSDVLNLDLTMEAARQTATQATPTGRSGVGVDGGVGRNATGSALDKNISLSRNESAGMNAIEIDGVRYNLDDMDEPAAGAQSDAKPDKKQGKKQDQGR